MVIGKLCSMQQIGKYYMNSNDNIKKMFNLIFNQRFYFKKSFEVFFVAVFCTVTFVCLCIYINEVNIGWYK